MVATSTTALGLREAGERIEALVGRIGESPDPSVRAAGEELVRRLLEYYGAALERILEIVYEAPDGPELIDRIGDDELAGAALVLHGLHPVALEDRVSRAIERVKPYLGSHGGGVEVSAIDGDVVRLRLEGSCDGCPSSTVTLHYALEKAILEAAPEIARVEAEADADPVPRAPQLIQLERRANSSAPPGGPPTQPPGPRPGRREDSASLPSVDWIAVDAAVAPLPGRMTALDLAGTRVLLCAGDEATWAYIDECAGCGAALEDGRFDPPVVACATCSRRYDVRAAGAEIDGVLHLDPLPLLSDTVITRIAVPIQARPAGLELGAFR